MSKNLNKLEVPKVEINRRAPVIGAAEAPIDVPITIVWRLLSDLARWPEWNRAISRMGLDGPVQVGTSFRWRSGASRIVSRLEEVDPPRRIVWSGRTMGIRAVHVYELSAADGITRVRTEESFEGLPARILRRTLKRMLDRDLADGLEMLKTEAERQAQTGVTCKEDAPPLGQVH